MTLPPTANLVVVTSALKDPEADRDRFLLASRLFMDWLRAQPGFLRYELFQAADGGYCDTMLWETPEQAAEANARFEETAVRAEFAELVENYRGFLGVVQPLDQPLTGP